MARVRILPLALGLALMIASPAQAAPTAGEPRPMERPVTQGEVEAFVSNSTPDADPISSVVWDFGDGTPEVTDNSIGPAGVSRVRHTFANAGRTTITVTVTDAGSPPETATASNTIQVNAPPVASFTTLPDPGVAGQTILFESTSTDPDNDGFRNHQWDFDNDGDFEAEGPAPQASHSFPSAGSYPVGLRVEDGNGSFASTVQTVNVVAAPAGNALPVAQFAVSDSTPVVGQQVSFESFSHDPDGLVTSQRWDLDGDGDFDENVQGRNAFTSYASPGTKTVRLEVRDSSDAVQIQTRNVTVRALPASRRLSLMSPFPVVRYTGTHTPDGARIALLEVKGPRGMRVTVRCAGQDCPVEQVSKRKLRRKPVHVRAFNRFMRKGTVLVVRVRKGNLIGKHSRILIRGGKPPKARHLCLLPGKRKGTPCPRGRRAASAS